MGSLQQPDGVLRRCLPADHPHPWISRRLCIKPLSYGAGHPCAVRRCSGNLECCGCGSRGRRNAVVLPEGRRQRRRLSQAAPRQRLSGAGGLRFVGGLSPGVRMGGQSGAALGMEAHAADSVRHGGDKAAGGDRYRAGCRRKAPVCSGAGRASTALVSRKLRRCICCRKQAEIIPPSRKYCHKQGSKTEPQPEYPAAARSFL